MDKLFKKKHDLESTINQFSKDLAQKAVEGIDNGEFTKDELIAYSEMIRGGLTSTVGFELLRVLIWKANDLENVK